MRDLAKAIVSIFVIALMALLFVCPYYAVTSTGEKGWACLYIFSVLVSASMIDFLGDLWGGCNCGCQDEEEESEDYNELD